MGMLAAGGLVLVKSADISMESEDLWISRDLIRVSYVFKNEGPADVKAEVAFPIPGRPQCDEDEPDRGLCPKLFISRGENPLSFKLFVEGKPTAFKTTTRTTTEDGISHLWTTHYWLQIFPKGRSIAISHEYTPARGQAFTGPEEAFRRKMRETYCVGPKLMDLIAGTGKRYEYETVHYILTTGANWKGPIKSFKLTIAKRSSSDRVSTCISDTRRLSPTTFEVVRSNFVPTDDLRFVFFAPP
jgi:hypothetical protein